MQGLNWAELVAGIILATSVGTRLAGWLVARARFVRIVCEIIERLAGLDVSTRAVKGEIDSATAEAGGEVRAFADGIAALAERARAKTGKASDRRATTRLARFGRGVSRWAPIIGAFL